MEVFSIWGVLSILIFTIIKNDGYTTNIGLVLTFAAATYRMIPTVNAINGSLQEIAYYKTSLKAVEGVFSDDSIMNSNRHENLTRYDLQKNIVLENISFKYKNANRDILRNVNLNIAKGERVGITGKTGSGKTTLVNIFA